MPGSSSPYPDNAYLDPRLEHKLLTRLSRAEGHLRGVKRMLHEHEDCAQILLQPAAVQAALRNVSLKLRNEHLDSCVEAGASSGHEAIAQLKRSIALMLK